MSHLIGVSFFKVGLTTPTVSRWGLATLHLRVGLAIPNSVKVRAGYAKKTNHVTESGGFG